MTLNSAIRQLVVQLEANGRNAMTIRIYKAELERLARHVGPRTSVTKIGPDVLARYLAGPGSRSSSTGNARSPRTMNRARTAIRHLADYLVGVGALKQSPARLLQNARVHPPVPATLTAEEERRFVRALAADRSLLGQRDEALFATMLLAGLRVTAAVTLRVEDLDLRGGTAVSVGKNGRSQRVILNRTVVRLLRAHIKRAGVSSGPVFPGRSGRLTTRAAQYRFLAIAKRAGITRKVTPHVLRHSFGRNLQRRTHDLRICQVALGHARLSTTQLYTSVDERELRRALAS